MADTRHVVSVDTFLILEAILAACPRLTPTQARAAALNVRKVIEADPAAARAEKLATALERVTVTHCREWCKKKDNRCGAPAEFILWGKLFPPEALGPRCYDHAGQHVDHRGLGDPSYAIVDLRPARAALAEYEGSGTDDS